MSRKKDDGKSSFWSTMPGIITAIAGLITAVGGFITIIYTTGPFKPIPSATNTSLIVTDIAPTFTLAPLTNSPASVTSLTATEVPVTPTEAELLSNITDDKGVAMVLVPAGAFTMGSDESGDLEERPAHTVNLGDFYIDKYEVSNKLYKACADAGACLPPKNLGSNRRSKYYGDSQFTDHPVINVTWDMAKAYCEWRGGRLPKEAEWEKAARGQGGNLYPWGNDKLNTTLANYGNNEGDTDSVDSHPTGVSKYGAYNMAGNVWEWVDDWFDAYPGGSPSASVNFGTTFKIIRGGSWKATAVDLPAFTRSAQDPTNPGINSIGIRCAKDANP